MVGGKQGHAVVGGKQGHAVAGGKQGHAVVGGKQGHAPCKILFLQQSLFLCHMNFMEIIRLSQN